MIGWLELFGSSAWILGLALILAACGMACYRAREQGSGLSHALGMSDLEQVFSAGLTLFCVGLLAASHALWEQVAWGLLAGGFWVRALMFGQRRRRTTETDTRAEARER